MAIITIKEIDKDSVTVRVDFMDRDLILGVWFPKKRIWKRAAKNMQEVENILIGLR